MEFFMIKNFKSIYCAMYEIDALINKKMFFEF